MSSLVILRNFKKFKIIYINDHFSSNEYEQKYIRNARSVDELSQKMYRLIVLSTSCLVPPSPKSKKCVIKVAIENAKLKLLKVLSSYNNALFLSIFFNN